MTTVTRSKLLRSLLFGDAQEATCFYCGARRPVTRLTVDHATPTFRGGTDDPTNLVPACFSCNQLKGPLTVDEYRSVVGNRTRRLRLTRAALGQGRGAA